MNATRSIEPRGRVRVASAFRASAAALALAAAGIVASPSLAQRAPAPALGDGPWRFEAADDVELNVSVVARALEHPWGLAFLPNGDMLVTERPGRLRLIRDGELWPEPVADLPEVSRAPLAGLMDLALHPDFATNGFVYFSYSKPGDNGVSNTLGRGRWDGERLVAIEDVFVADAYGINRGGASRIAFAPDGRLFMTVGGAGAVGDERAQDPATHIGKTLRLTDAGEAPPDNPFVGREGYAPEIYTLGHRNQIGLAFHPETGQLFASEQGPLGGDEVNVLRPGRNYGWPLVTHGRNYDGTRAAPQPWRADLEAPWLFWVPSIAVTGMTFYTGDAFPAWQGSLFVGGLIEARFGPSGQIQRIVMNENGELGREPLLRALQQRIRGVWQGPDGLLYALTDEDDGAVLRLAPERSFYPADYTPAYPAGTGPRVAIDAHHGNLHTVGGSYAPFAALLERDGFRVAGIDEPLSLEALRDVDILVISNATGPDDAATPGEASAFAIEEIDALDEWVRGGGALMLVADHDPWPAAASLLAERFGLELKNAFVYDGPPGGRSGTIRYDKNEGALSTHAVTDSVEAVTSFLGSALRVTGEHVPLMRLSPQAVAQPGMTPEAAGAEPVGGWLQGALVEHGAGRVAAFSEAGMFSAQERGGRPMGMNAPGAEHNPRFTLNVLRWLAGGR